MDLNIVTFTFILIFIVFSSKSTIQDDSMEFTEYNETVTWEEARTGCRENGREKLVTALDVSQHSELQPGEFWIFGFHTLSTWIWMRGCFNKTSLDNAGKTPSNAQSHSAATCSFKCKDSPYFALDAVELCYCLDEKEVADNLNYDMRIYPKHCQKCPDDQSSSSSICGKEYEGGKSVFLYQRHGKNSPQFENVEQEKDPNLNCVTVRYNQSLPTDSTLILTSCSEKHRGLCIKDNGTLVNAGRPNKSTWLDTVDQCHDVSGYPIGDENISGLKGVDSGRIWIGLYREDARILNDELFDESMDITSCLYVTHIESEGVGAPIKSDCNETRRYICKKLGEMDIMSTRSQIQENTSLYVSVENPTTPEMSPNLNIILAIVGGCVGAIILIIIVFVIVLCIKRSKKNKQENHIEGHLDYAYAGMPTRTSHDQLLSNSRNGIGNEYSETDNMARGKRSGDDDYAYASKNFSDPDRVYVDSGEGEYDILGKKRQKLEEHDSGKLYGNINDDNVYNVSSYSKKTQINTDVYDSTKNIQREENVYDKSETVTKRANGPKEKNENTENNKENIYIDTQDDEYDVLGKKREKVNNEDSGQLYGRINDDGIYDVSKGSIVTKHDNGIYDTSKSLSDNAGIYDKTEAQLNIQVQANSVHFNADK